MCSILLKILNKGCFEVLSLQSGPAVQNCDSILTSLNRLSTTFLESL